MATVKQKLDYKEIVHETEMNKKEENSHVAKARKIAFCVSTLALVWTMVLVFVVAVSLAVIALIIVFNYRSEFIAAQLILQNSTNQDSQELRNELYQASSEIQLLQIQLNDSKNQIQAFRAQLSQINLTTQLLVSQLHQELEYQITSSTNSLQSELNNLSYNLQSQLLNTSVAIETLRSLVIANNQELSSQIVSTNISLLDQLNETNETLNNLKMDIEAVQLDSEKFQSGTRGTIGDLQADLNSTKQNFASQQFNMSVAIEALRFQVSSDVEHLRSQITAISSTLQTKLNDTKVAIDILMTQQFNTSMDVEVLRSGNEHFLSNVNGNIENLQAELNRTNTQAESLTTSLNKDILALTNHTGYLQQQWELHLNQLAQMVQAQNFSFNALIQDLHTQMNETRSIFEERICEQESNLLLLIQDLQIVQFIIEELEPFYLGTVNNPAASCQKIPQYRPSGEYWVQVDNSSFPVQVYCDINRTTCCNTSSNWMRIGYLNMTDPQQTCPEGFELVNRTEPPLRTCGRPEPPGCVSTFYQSRGVEYTQVCGRIIAYQEAIPNGFGPSVHGLNDIELGYIDGVSLTHGHSPRQHIWTFAAAGNDVGSSTTNACPCIQSPFTGTVPSFVTNHNYFCDTGSRVTPQIGIFYADDPLWDGQGCGGTSTCCGFNNPPWFCKQLSRSTTDSIEMRLCANAGSGTQEDSPIELVEIYIK